jgi:hypothetical protein
MRLNALVDVLASAGEFLGDAGYTGVQVSPPQEDIVARDYPDADTRQEPWCAAASAPARF